MSSAIRLWGWDADQDVLEVAEGLDSREPAGLDQGRAMSAGHAAGEEPLLPADGHGAELAFGPVVVDLQASVRGVGLQADHWFAR